MGLFDEMEDLIGGVVGAVKDPLGTAKNAGQGIFQSVINSIQKEPEKSYIDPIFPFGEPEPLSEEDQKKVDLALARIEKSDGEIFSKQPFTENLVNNVLVPTGHLFTLSDEGQAQKRYDELKKQYDERNLLGKVFTVKDMIGNYLAGQVTDAGKGLLSLGFASADLITVPVRATLEITGADEGIGKGLNEWAIKTSNNAEAWQEHIAKSRDTELGMGLGSGLGSLGIGISVNIATKSTFLAGLAMGTLDTIGTYHNAREKGESPEKSLGYTVAKLITATALERLPLDLYERTKSNFSLFSKRQALAEGGQETAQQVTSNIIDKQYNEEQDIWEGVLASFLVGGIIGGATGAISNSYEAAQEYAHNPENIQAIANILKVDTNEAKTILEETGKALNESYEEVTGRIKAGIKEAQNIEEKQGVTLGMFGAEQFQKMADAIKNFKKGFTGKSAKNEAGKGVQEVLKGEAEKTQQGEETMLRKEEISKNEEIINGNLVNKKTGEVIEENVSKVEDPGRLQTEKMITNEEVAQKESVEEISDKEENVGDSKISKGSEKTLKTAPAKPDQPSLFQQKVNEVLAEKAKLDKEKGLTEEGKWAKLEKKDELFQNKWLKLRVKADDKEIFLKELRNLPGTEKAIFDNPYTAEQLKHGRIDARVNESFEDGFHIDKKIKDYANRAKIDYKQAEEDVNEFLLAEATTTAKAQEYDDEIIKIAKEIMQYHRDTITQFKKDGMISEFAEKGRVEQLFDIAYTTDKSGKKVATDVLNNAVFSRVNAIMLTEQNSVKRELWQLWQNNKENELYTEIFEDVDDADLDKWFAKVKREHKKKLHELKKIRDYEEVVFGLDVKIQEVEHGKTGATYFSVTVNKRMPPETFNEILKKAKKMNGWYSSFQGKGAKPGFHFKTKEAAEAFIAKLSEETSLLGGLLGQKRKIEKQASQEKRKIEAEIMADIEKKIRIKKKQLGIINEQGLELSKKKAEEKIKIEEELAKLEEEALDAVSGVDMQAELKRRQDEIRAERENIEKMIPKEIREDVLNFLWFRHAPERNKTHGEGAAGIDTETAFVKMEKLKKKKNFPQIKRLANRISGWDSSVLARLLQGKVIQKEEYVEVSNIYNYHVPLRRNLPEKVDDSHIFDISIKDEDPPIWKAKGSDLEIKDILDNIEYNLLRGEKLIVQKMEMHNLEQEIITERERIITAKKEKIQNEEEEFKQELEIINAQILKLEEAKENISKKAEERAGREKSAKLAKLEEQKQFYESLIKKRQYNAGIASAEIESLKNQRKRVLKEFKNPLAFLRTMVKGEMKITRIKEPDIARAINNTNISDIPLFLQGGSFLGNTGKFLFEKTAAGTNLIGRLATTYNPVFAPFNGLRDLWTFLTNFGSSHGIKEGFKRTKEVPKEYKVIFDAIRGVHNKETELYRQFLMDGGTTGGMALSLVQKKDQSFNKLKDFVNRANITEYGDTRTVLDWFARQWNEIAENASRFETYKALLEQGRSRREAALAAKNITVNFNKKGEWGHYVNQLFLFSNAALQGTKNFYSRSIIDGKLNPDWFKMVAGIMAVGWLAQMWNDAWDDEWRDKATDYEREGNFLIMIPGEKDEYTALKIPKSLEFASVSMLGNMAYDLALGKEKGKMAVGMVAESLFGSVNVLGQAGTFNQQFTPSLFRPLLQNWENIKWSGNGMVPTGKGALYQRYYDSTGKTATGKTFIALSKFLYEKTGWDTSPEQWKNLFEQYGSGLGRESMRITNIVGSPTGVTVNDIPLVERFLVHREGKENADMVKRNQEKRKRVDEEGWLEYMLPDWEVFNFKQGAVVVRVIDGDTIEVILDKNQELETVRFLDVDTPETHGGRIDFGGIAAAEKTEEMIPPGSKIKLKRGKAGEADDTGKYGRALRYIEIEGGQNLNEILLKEGYARVSSYTDPGKYEDMIEEAKLMKKGIYKQESRDLTKEQIDRKISIIEQMIEEEKADNFENLTPKQQEQVAKRLHNRAVTEKVEQLSSKIKALEKKEEKTDRENYLIDLHKMELSFLLKEPLEYEPDLSEYLDGLKKEREKRFLEEGVPTEKELADYFKETGDERVNSYGKPNKSTLESFQYRAKVAELEKEGKTIAGVWNEQFSDLSKQALYEKIRVNYKMKRIRAKDIDEMEEAGLIGSADNAKEFVKMSLDDIQDRWGLEYKNKIRDLEFQAEHRN